MNISNITNSDYSSTNLTEDSSHEGEASSQTHVILFIFASCALGALVRQIVHSISHKISLPYTVVLLVIGVLFGLVSSKVEVLHHYVEIVNTDPHIILFVFLPVLIFESAFAMEVHTFKKCFFQVLLLAVPGLALMSLLTCILSLYLFTYGWDWNTGMMFGSILSATDPIAVVAILRDIGASKRLAMVTEGESLMNDGAAIVFFKVFLNLCTSTGDTSGGGIVLKFLQVSLGGPAFGFLMARITLFWLSRIFNDALAEITITLASTYLTFYIGEELLGVSGVLAVVVLGVVMSGQRTSISPEVETFLHRFWETLAYLANTLIFILVGVIISEKVIYKIHGTDWFFMFALYFGLNVIRGLVIGLLSPILQHIGYGMTWKDGIVLTWSGLRGAVGLTLALLVWEDKNLDQENVRLKVLIHVAGVVFLTLLINGTTILHLLRLLGMSDVSAAKRMAMASALRFLQDMRQKTLSMLKTDRFLADAEWEMVEKACEIEDPYKTTQEEADLDESLMEIRPNLVCPECDCSLPSQPTQKELRDMTNEAILRMLKAEKLSYWRQFEQGMLSRDAVRKLQECTECAADNKGKFIDVEDIKKSWEVPSVLIRAKRKLKEIIRKRPVNIKEESVLTQFLHKVTTHTIFNYIVYVIIGIDTVNSTLALIAEYIDLFSEYKLVMQIINAVLVFFYVTEVILKLIPQGRSFLGIVWQVLSLFIIGHGIVDAVLQFALSPLDDGTNIAVRDILVVSIVLRVFRLFRLVEPLLPTFLMMIKTRISMHLSYGYDLGRGFVAGEDEVRKLIDHMVDNKDIARQLKQHSDDCKLEVIRCLGLLQKQNPEIALSAKTRQAIRSVLNNLRDGIHELWQDGVLQEAEGEKLREMVEVKMKRLLTAPPSIPLPAPEKMLLNVTWLEKNDRLIDYMQENAYKSPKEDVYSIDLKPLQCRAKIVNYDYGDIILKQGDPTSGIFIIVSGMVRLETTIKQRHSVQKTNLPLETKIIDFMTTGNIIGEMGLLTQRQRVATVRCETAVQENAYKSPKEDVYSIDLKPLQLLFISSEDMEQAIKEFADADPPLEYRLWKVCAIRLATGVLMDQPGYQGLTKEKIKLRLENAYIWDIRDGLTITIDSSMADIILINGFAQNSYTREQFVGPSNIPWTVLKLNLLENAYKSPKEDVYSIDLKPLQPDKGPTPIVLIVPSEFGQVAPVAERRLSAHDVRSEHGAYISSLSRLCLRHASLHRNQIETEKRPPLAKRHSVQHFLGLARRFSRENSKGDNRVSESSNGLLPGARLSGRLLGKRMSTPACMETNHRIALPSSSSTAMVGSEGRQDSRYEKESITSLPEFTDEVASTQMHDDYPDRELSDTGIGRQHSSSGVIMTDILQGSHQGQLIRRSSDVTGIHSGSFVVEGGVGPRRSLDNMHDRRLSPLTIMEEDENDTSDVSDACSVEAPVDTETRNRTMGGGSTKGQDLEPSVGLPGEMVDDVFDEEEEKQPVRPEKVDAAVGPSHSTTEVHIDISQRDEAEVEDTSL